MGLQANKLGLWTSNAKVQMHLQKFIFLAAAVLLSVSAVNAQFLQSKVAEYAKGVVIEKVVAASDPSQSYALYLPSAYNPALKSPILYCFDPGARGSLPVARFKDAAEKYNYIIVGSNNSRNGPNQPLNDIIKILWEDTHARFPIDEKRTYLAGFSGGARVAISLGYSIKGLVAGVIACSGGFPSRISPNTPLPFVLFETAGSEDFNNPEMQSLSRTIAGSPVANRLAVFEGGHDWLPSELALDAIEWMEIQAMRTGIKVKDEELIDRLFGKALMRARAAEVAKEAYLAYSYYAAAAQDFQGLREVTEFQQKAGALKATKEVREAFKREQWIAEEQARRLLSIDLLIRALDQSENKMATLSEVRHSIAIQKKAAAAEQSSADRVVARRVINSVFVGSFEQGSAAIFQKDYQRAIIHFSIGTEIQPDNARTFYHLARAYALAKDKSKALGALHTAAEKGFVDLEALAGDEFVGLRNEKRFNEINEIVKNNWAAAENKRN